MEPICAKGSKGRTFVIGRLTGEEGDQPAATSFEKVPGNRRAPEKNPEGNISNYRGRRDSATRTTLYGRTPFLGSPRKCRPAAPLVKRKNTICRHPGGGRGRNTPSTLQTTSTVRWVSGFVLRSPGNEAPGFFLRDQLGYTP